MFWFFRRRKKPAAPAAAAGRTVTAADGRTYRQVSPASAESPSIWKLEPDDGKTYFPDLTFDTGQTSVPIMRAFSA